MNTRNLRMINAAERPDRHLELKHKRLFPKSGDRLWALRQQRGLTQRQVGEECGLSPGVISRLECGYTQGMGRTLARIGYNLGLSVDYLLNLSDSPEIANRTIHNNTERRRFK